MVLGILGILVQPSMAVRFTEFKSIGSTLIGLAFFITSLRKRRGRLLYALFGALMFAAASQLKSGPRPDFPALSETAKGKIVVITGAAAGVGFAGAKQLAELGCTVIGAVRENRGAEFVKDIKRLVPNANVSFVPLDLSSLKSVEEFPQKLLSLVDHIDVLVLNAGVGIASAASTADGFAGIMGVNHLGHFHLTSLLLPVLKKSKTPRVVTVSSLMAFEGFATTENDSWKSRLTTAGGFQGGTEYQNSKLANLLFAMELQARNPWLTSISLNPGFVATTLLRNMASFAEVVLKFLSFFMIKNGEEGGWTIVSASLEKVVGGGYYTDSRLCPNPETATLQSARELWKASEEVIDAWKKSTN